MNCKSEQKRWQFPIDKIRYLLIIEEKHEKKGVFHRFFGEIATFFLFYG